MDGGGVDHESLEQQRTNVVTNVLSSLLFSLWQKSEKRGRQAKRVRAGGKQRGVTGEGSRQLKKQQQRGQHCCRLVNSGTRLACLLALCDAHSVHHTLSTSITLTLTLTGSVMFLKGSHTMSTCSSSMHISRRLVNISIVRLRPGCVLCEGGWRQGKALMSGSAFCQPATNAHHHTSPLKHNTTHT